ncbi:MAG: PKD domain-containing protein [Bacteroidetes bacterium]|nr:PKD domain-containing protein [Bacteroidota bacterium]
MKRLLLSLFVFVFGLTTARSQPASLRAQHAKEKMYLNSTVENSLKVVTPAAVQNVAGGCNYWIPRDATWQVVPFTNGTAPGYRNDDGSSPLITLPFNFCLYGTNYTNVYINNNGNISFNSSYSTFTPNGFPDPTHAMVAPFWADVDTRGALSGLVYYKVNATNMIVQWEHVGYFASHDDKLNTFQLIISDGNDPIIQIGKNVSFYYGDMQWTTGDASSGTNGFGGSPATAGINRGDGIDYIQIGTFDHAGNSYDGPFGNVDGIDFLDYTYFAIDACFSNTNVPPIANSPNACDTVYVCAGDTFLLSASYLSPEPTQVTTAYFNGNGIGGATVLSSTSGNIADISVQIVTQAASPGFYGVSLLGIDNGVPVDTTFVNVIVAVLPSATANFTIPPVACSGDTLTLTYTGSNIGTTTYAWNFGGAGVLSGSGSGPFSLQWNTGGNDTVWLVVNGQNGCGDSLGSVVQVTSLPVVAFSTPPSQCLDGNSFQFIAGGNLVPGTQYSWTFGNDATPMNSNSQNQDSVSYSSPGFHTVELNASYNNCIAVPYVHSVEVYISPVAAFSPDVSQGCVPLDVQFTNFSSGENNSYSWNFYDSTFDANTHPFHEFTSAGDYSVSLTATTIHGCTDQATYLNLIKVYPAPTASFTPSPAEVPIYSPFVDFLNYSLGGKTYSWDFGDGSTSKEFHPTHQYTDTGTYKIILIVSNEFGCIDTITGTERVEPEFTFYVPNAFTPNDDGKNDLFIPYCTSVVPDNYLMRIFDRWGDVVFSSSNISVGWNGHSKGGNTIVPAGAYVYQLEFTDNQHEVHKLTGKITVFH